MIQLASSIGSEWNTSTSPFYMELYGETRPTINLAFAEVLGPGPVSADDSGMPTSTIAEPVYEYWWTVGFHRGHAPEVQHWRDRVFHRGEGAHVPGTEAISFEDPAAWIGLYFPTNVNWRVKEITATLKFLTPIKDQHQLWKDISDNIAKLSPLVADAGSLASLLPGGGGASAVLSTVAKLQVGSVPQTTVNWSVEKTTHVGVDGSRWQGVEWRLPQNIFDILGGRVSGSVAVTIMEALRSDEGEEAALDAGTMLARANVAVRGVGDLRRIPEPEGDSTEEAFISLPLTPKRPVMAG